MQPIDFALLCRDFNIPTADTGHSHNRPGWVNVPCPFCSGHSGFHLGYDLSRNLFSCWRCKGHPVPYTLQTLLKCSKSRVKALLRQYRARPVHNTGFGTKTPVTALKWPCGTVPMGEQHRAYLASRCFNADRLQAEWELMGTGPVGPYKFRILAPIHFGGALVSYQGRDITNRSPLRYKACAQVDEVRPHQKCLYGLDKVHGNSVVVVEGITDVWRLGPGAVATFGIDYTTTQVGLLSGFKRKFVLFDSVDPQAIVQAEKLAATLAAFGGSTEVIELEAEDPAKLPQSEADALMRELLG